MGPASVTPRASGCKTASKAVVTEIEHAAPEAITLNDDDYVYICVPREKMAPVDNGLTETAQHQVSQTAGPQNAAPVLHSVPVHPPAPASQQWCGDSSSVNFARVAVVQPGKRGDTIVDSVENDPHVEGLPQHLAGCLAVPGASAAGEVKVLMNSCSSITAMSEGLVQTLRGQPRRTKTALTQAFDGYARVATSLGQKCDIETQPYPLYLTIETPLGSVRYTIPSMFALGKAMGLSSGRRR